MIKTRNFLTWAPSDRMDDPYGPTWADMLDGHVHSFPIRYIDGLPGLCACGADPELVDEWDEEFSPEFPTGEWA